VVNLVHHVHREQWPYLFGRRMARAGWWVESRLAPRVYRTGPYVAVSDATRRELVEQGVDGTRIRVIHNGTDDPPDRTFHRAPNPTLVVLGRLVPQKRIELAIDVAGELLSRWPSLRLDVVGSGWWSEELEAYTTLRGLSDVVTFHGHVSEQQKHELLARAWVHMLPSVKEGWGLVVLEAGVHGTPTVAFRAAGGPADSVLHERTGLLVDDAAHFLGAVATLLADGPQRQHLGSNARSWAARFRWERTVEAWESVLTEAVADDGARQDPS
jgi:glycosyltransferase involved in cell wall biosynthesis